MRIEPPRRLVLDCGGRTVMRELRQRTVQNIAAKLLHRGVAA
jgi:hypothetical protein